LTIVCRFHHHRRFKRCQKHGALELLFVEPAVTARRPQQRPGNSVAGARDILDALARRRILREVTGRRWFTVFVAEELAPEPTGHRVKRRVPCTTPDFPTGCGNTAWPARGRMTKGARNRRAKPRQ
jgi:hypothetical protein